MYNGPVAECNTRIEHIDRVRKAYIMLKDVPIAELYHEFSLSGEFDWVIKILWDNWYMMRDRGYTMDIAGIDDTIEKEEYIRRYNPAFVTQRTIPEGRKDFRPFLRKLKLRSNDLFEVLCRSHGACGNDDYYVSRTPNIVVDINTLFDYDIPDYDTDCYGWLDENGNPSPYREATSETMNYTGDTLFDAFDDEEIDYKGEEQMKEDVRSEKLRRVMKTLVFVVQVMCVTYTFELLKRVVVKEIETRLENS